MRLRHLLLVLLAISLTPVVHAAEQPWSVQWIGPSSNSDVSALKSTGLAGSSWIWFPHPPGPVLDVTNENYYFRHPLDIPAGATVRAALATFTGDDEATLFINGQEIGKSGDWRQAQTFEVTAALHPGANVVALHGYNHRREAGLICKIEVLLADGKLLSVVSDGSWKVSGNQATGWNQTGFDDAAWQPVQVEAVLGTGAWGNIEVGPRKSDLWTCYRKRFTLARKPTLAPTRIAVDSRYWLWVNGKMVVFEGGLKRGPTPNDTYYDAIDLAPYLVAGSNTIALLHWYWGKDGFSHKSSGQAGLVFEMQAGATTVRSDKSWKALAHPAYGHAGGKQPNYRISESPIHFDARADIGDWMAPQFDDTAWPSPVEFGLPPVAPWHNLRLRPIPFWKDYGLKDYANAATLPTVATGEPIVAQLPYNAQITAWLKIDAPAGLAIDMETDDKLADIHSEYVTKAGVQQFEGLAWMNGHHVLYHIPQGVKILGLKYRETGYATNLSGSFTCDQEFYNRLWMKCQRTLYITMRDNFMDCPDRERGQWWGDAVNEIGETFYALSPSTSRLSSKAIYNLMEWQRADKTIFAPVPAGNYDAELPPQMLASVGKYGFWTHYFYTGDAKTVTDVYPRVRDYLSIWQTDAQGLVVHRQGGWDWEDWGDNIDARVLDNAWFCLALEGAANIADLAQRPAEAQAYRAERLSIMRAVNEHFWNGTAYRNPDYKGATDDRSNALCVVAGIATPDKFPALKTVLTTEQHASPYMEKYVLEALALMGEPDAALARMKQRYGPGVASPLTTLPENFPMSGSDNHAWSGGPLTILSQYFAGITPLTPAFATYQIKPQMGALRQIHTVVDSARGKIDLTLAREPERFTLRLISPPATSAVVSLPTDGRPVQSIKINDHDYWKNGQVVKSMRGVVFQGVPDNAVQVVLAPGTWIVTVELA